MSCGTNSKVAIFRQKMDEIECNVVDEFFCRNRKEPLLVGSVKSTTGHCEATAGYLSLLKAVFALDSDEIAPNMHYSKPNPNIKPLVDGKLKVSRIERRLKIPLLEAYLFFKKKPDDLDTFISKIQVVTETTKLPGPIVAVNSMSITGELNHAVLKQNPK